MMDYTTNQTNQTIWIMGTETSPCSGRICKMGSNSVLEAVELVPKVID